MWFIRRIHGAKIFPSSPQEMSEAISGSFTAEKIDQKNMRLGLSRRRSRWAGVHSQLPHVGL
jgi:hypothetical protein